MYEIQSKCSTYAMEQYINIVMYLSGDMVAR